MTKHRALRFAVTVSVCTAGLQLAGYLFPTVFTWGFHLLGFLPPLYFVVYLFLMAAILILTLSGRTRILVTDTALAANDHPAAFLTIVSLLFAALVIVFRQKVYLLGDNVVIIKNLEQTFAGTHPLHLGYEPLAMLYFYGVASILGLTQFDTIMTAMTVGEILLGIAFIVNVFILTRTLWPEPVPRFLGFLFLVTAPYMQLFFGYPEIYAPLLFALSGFVLVTSSFLRGKVPFWTVTAAFALTVLTHYLAACLAGAMLFLAWKEYKTRGTRTIITGAVVAAAVGVLAFALMRFDPQRLLPAESHTHFLTFTESNDDGFQAYPFASSNHLIDIVNLFLLTGFPVVLLLFTNAGVGKSRGTTTAERFFGISALAAFFLLIILKFDLGAARDWDLAAPFVFLMLFVPLVPMLAHPEERIVDALGHVALIVLAQTLLWISFNSTVAPSIARAKTLRDSRFLPYEGYYQTTLHLSMAYYVIGDTASMADVWQTYLDGHPDDLRAYPQLIRSSMYTLHNGPERLIELYETWLKKDPQNQNAKIEYSDFCINAGNVYFDHEKIPEAGTFYQKAIQLNPHSALACNNLGNVFERLGNSEQAIAHYQNAILIDSGYSDSYWNLGRLYDARGDTRRSLAMMRKAAFHGDSSAQNLLRKNGLTW